MEIIPKITLLIVGIALFDVCLVLLFMQLERLIGNVKHSLLKKEEDESDTVVPVIDTDVLLYTISQYFRYYQTGNPYRVEYDVYNHSAIEQLRGDGWKIKLEADAAGNLFYAVHGDPIKV